MIAVVIVTSSIDTLGFCGFLGFILKREEVRNQNNIFQLKIITLE